MISRNFNSFLIDRLLNESAINWYFSIDNDNKTIDSEQSKQIERNFFLLLKRFI